MKDTKGVFNKSKFLESLKKATLEGIFERPKEKHIGRVIMGLQDNANSETTWTLLRKKLMENDWSTVLKSELILHRYIENASLSNCANLANLNLPLNSFMDHSERGSAHSIIIQKYFAYIKSNAMNHAREDSFILLRREEWPERLQVMNDRTVIREITCMITQLKHLIKLGPLFQQTIRNYDLRLTKYAAFLVLKDAYDLYLPIAFLVDFIANKYFDFDKEIAQESLKILEKFNKYTNQLGVYFDSLPVDGLKRPSLINKHACKLEDMRKHLEKEEIEWEDVVKAHGYEDLVQNNATLLTMSGSNAQSEMNRTNRLQKIPLRTPDPELEEKTAYFGKTPAPLEKPKTNSSMNEFVDFPAASMVFSQEISSQQSSDLSSPEVKKEPDQMSPAMANPDFSKTVDFPSAQLVFNYPQPKQPEYRMVSNSPSAGNSTRHASQGRSRPQPAYNNPLNYSAMNTPMVNPIIGTPFLSNNIPMYPANNIAGSQPVAMNKSNINQPNKQYTNQMPSSSQISAINTANSISSTSSQRSARSLSNHVSGYKPPGHYPPMSSQMNPISGQTALNAPFMPNSIHASSMANHHNRPEIPAANFMTYNPSNMMNFNIPNANLGNAAPSRTRAGSSYSAFDNRNAKNQQYYPNRAGNFP